MVRKIWSLFGNYKPSKIIKTKNNETLQKQDNTNDYTPLVIINLKELESLKIIENYFNDISVPKINTNPFPIVIINIKEFESFKIIENYFNDTYTYVITKINTSTDSLNNSYMSYE